MTRWSAITRTRGRRSALAYGSRSTTAAEDNLNRLVHHERGRYSATCLKSGCRACWANDPQPGFNLVAVVPEGGNLPEVRLHGPAGPVTQNAGGPTEGGPPG